MNKKVLYIITKSDIGGAQKYINDLASNLDKIQFEAKILYGGRDLKWLSNKTWPWFLFLNDWLAILELVKIYGQEKPDVIHLHSSKAGVLGSLAAKIYKVKCQMSISTGRQANVKYSPPKVVFTAHGWVFNPTNALSFPARLFYVFLHKFAALFQDKIMSVGSWFGHKNTVKKWGLEFPSFKELRIGHSKYLLPSLDSVQLLKNKTL